MSLSILPLGDYERYGRQMILDGIGLPGLSSVFLSDIPAYLCEGQLKLHRASIAVVGAGGLGCPALQYLCTAGIGKATLPRSTSR